MTEILKLVNSCPVFLDHYTGYMTNLNATLLFGSFLVPVLVSLFAYEGWAKLWLIVFCIPILSQILSIVFLYNLFFNYNKLIKGGLQAPGDVYVAWGILIFVILAILIFILSSLYSQSRSKIESESQDKLISSIKDLFEEVNEL
jgi:hypothetical protein